MPDAGKPLCPMEIVRRVRCEKTCGSDTKSRNARCDSAFVPDRRLKPKRALFAHTNACVSLSQPTTASLSFQRASASPSGSGAEGPGHIALAAIAVLQKAPPPNAAHLLSNREPPSLSPLSRSNPPRERTRAEFPFCASDGLFGGRQKHYPTLQGLHSSSDGLFAGPDGTYSLPNKMNASSHCHLSRLDWVKSGSDGHYSATDGLFSTLDGTFSTLDKVFSNTKKPSPVRTRFYPGRIKASTSRTNVSPSRKNGHPTRKKSVQHGKGFLHTGKILVRAGQSSVQTGPKSLQAREMAPQSVLSLLPGISAGKSRDFHPAAHRFLPKGKPTTTPGNKHGKSASHLGWDGRSGQSIDLGHARPFLGWPRS